MCRIFGCITGINQLLNRVLLVRSDETIAISVCVFNGIFRFTLRLFGVFNQLSGVINRLIDVIINAVTVLVGDVWRSEIIKVV